MEKLYYSISEVADTLGEAVSLVRFWSNSFPKLVKPSRTAKGNRQYTKEDLEILKKIHYLVKVQGMTLDGAGKRLADEASSVDKRVKALDSLKAIKSQLEEIKNNL